MRDRVRLLAAVGLLLVIPGVARAADAAKGRTTFETRCAPCHGSDGKGDGPAAAAITPPPRNFRDPAFWNGRTAAQIAAAVRDGRPGTLMAPFNDVLSPAEIDDVVAYVESFRPAAH
jgi:high-affinity iron transporter